VTFSDFTASFFKFERSEEGKHASGLKIRSISALTDLNWIQEHTIFSISRSRYIYQEVFNIWSTSSLKCLRR